MNIADLNHLEAVSEAQVQGGWGYTYYQNDKVKLDVYTDIDLEDNSAVVDSVAEAYGSKTFTKISSLTYADEYSSVSAVYSFSAED